MQYQESPLDPLAPKQPKRLFTATRNGHAIFTRYIHIHRLLEKRVAQGIPVNDLFLVVPAEVNKLGAAEEGDDKLDTEFGSIRVFFVNGLKRSHLLNKKRYDYPIISRTRGASVAN